MLLRHRDQQRFSHTFHVHGHGRIRRASDTLDLGLQTIVVRNAHHGSGIVNPNENYAASSVGEGANLPSEVGGQGPLELGGEPFAQGNQVGQDRIAHTATRLSCVG